MPYIASTMTSDVKYTRWKSNPGGINTKQPITAMDHVLVKGGHGVASRRPDGGLVTPNGVVTKVTDDELAFLKKDETFNTHLKSGAVRIMASNTAPEKAAKDMLQEDKSAPLTAKDFKKGGRAAMPDSMKVNAGKKLT